MGIGFLERHEGVVLKAYRCPAGVWTIGAGLTAGSGVVKPFAGQTITAEEASRLLALALARNYEPRVNAAMPGANQVEFDAGVSFDFNTGAIHRATWAARWRKGGWAGVKAGLNAWVKGGGKVLPGLQRRRAEEYELMTRGVYGGEVAQARSRGTRHARFVLELSWAEIAAMREGLRKLGYDPGAEEGEVLQDCVKTFQRDHDLTVDGIVGRATLSTLQRRLDARVQAAAPAAATAGGAAETAAPDIAGLPDWAGPAIVAVALIWGLWVAWRYRDVIAAKVQRLAPRIAERLRSI